MKNLGEFILKHIFTAALTILLAISLSNSAFAHSHFGGSNPADGDIVTEPLHEIILNFEGKIEQGSFIDVTTKSGQVIELQDMVIGDGTLTGTVDEALPNDEYQVNWSIISVDGHPLEGDFSFTVDAPISESEEEVTEETTEEAPNTTEQSTENSETSSMDEDEKESSSTTVVLIVLVVILVVGGLFFFMKRKK